jgi:hypothetical protein
LRQQQAQYSETIVADLCAALLRWFTPYPTLPDKPRRTSGNTSRIKSLLRSLGSQRRARQQLEMIATEWRQRALLHADILRKFLDGWERREIVRCFASRGLYEDSRGCHYINELPQRLSDHVPAPVRQRWVKQQSSGSRQKAVPARQKWFGKAVAPIRA